MPTSMKVGTISFPKSRNLQGSERKPKTSLLPNKAFDINCYCKSSTKMCCLTYIDSGQGRRMRERGHYTGFFQQGAGEKSTADRTEFQLEHSTIKTAGESRWFPEGR